MLCELKSLLDTPLQATDGLIGTVKDLYFDDRAWVIRWFVVETGSWLSARRVLIAPVSVDAGTGIRVTLSAALSKAQVRDRPDTDTDSAHGPLGGQHLRSCNAVIGYHVEATDGDIGHVHGCLLEPSTWAIRYLVANTGHWWRGHEVLLAPRWIEAARWEDDTLNVQLNRAMVRAAPAYSTMRPLRRDHEIALHRHYARNGYWAAEVALENPEFQRLPAADHPLFR